MPEIPTANETTSEICTEDIEARLNKLVGSGDVNPEPVDCEEIDFRDMFLANVSQTYLASRCVERDDDSRKNEVLVEYHRIDVAPNQTRLILHSGFRPDFSEAPTVNASLIDAQGRIRVTGTTTFGTRIEITLADKHPLPSAVCVEVICFAQASHDS